MSPTGREVLRKLTNATVPMALRSALGELRVVQRVAGRTRVDPADRDTATQERAQHRWVGAAPDADLTWGKELDGLAFVDLLASLVPFTPQSRLLEIGPGYGRLLKAIVERELPFASYRGVDISLANVEYLSAEFGDPRIGFHRADVQTDPVEPFDIGFSSLTFKHLYPSFGPALANVARGMDANSRFVFDLIEGTASFLEHDDVTFVRRYGRGEVTELARSAGAEVVHFDEVVHAPGRKRLLTLIRRATT